MASKKANNGLETEDETHDRQAGRGHQISKKTTEKVDIAHRRAVCAKKASALQARSTSSAMGASRQARTASRAASRRSWHSSIRLHCRSHGKHMGWNAGSIARQQNAARNFISRSRLPPSADVIDRRKTTRTDEG